MNDYVSHERTLGSFFLHDDEKFNKDPRYRCHGEGITAGKVTINHGVLYITLNDYTTQHDRVPIMLALEDDSLILHVWSDCDQGDPTHKIDMTLAHQDFYAD